MHERCPLIAHIGLPAIDEDIPDVCRESCEGRMDEATRGQPAGEYVNYPNIHEQDCRHDGLLEYSHDALVAISRELRRYIIVDKCNDCNLEYGEQDYEFNCPKFD